MKISIIVPVYNSEKFVAKCIESIIAQTYEEWELLLIDDGSSDNSLKILRAYEKADYRIRVFCQENAGAGMARNIGIKNSSGDYIVFVDSDDTIEANYFEELAKRNTDIVFIDANQRDLDGNLIVCERMSVYKEMSKDDILRGQMTGKILWGGWRKAVKADLIKRNKIYYTSHQVGEEAVYSFLILWFAQDFSFIENTVYNYVVHRESLSHRLLDDPWGEVAIALKKKVIENGIYKEYANTINAFIITAAVVSLKKMALKYEVKEYCQKAMMRLRQMELEIDKGFQIDYNHMDTRVKLLIPFLKTRFVPPIYLISKFLK